MAAQSWRNHIAWALPMLRCFGRLVSATYCPTTLRHSQSAKLITDALGLDEPIADRRLNNIDYGVHKGRPLAFTPSRAAALEVPYEGGEAWTQVAARWQEFCRETLPEYEGGLVLLAGQSATAVRMLRHICNGISLEKTIAQAVPKVPFFSEQVDFPTENVVWRYGWPVDR